MWGFPAETKGEGGIGGSHQEEGREERQVNAECAESPIQDARLQLPQPPERVEMTEL